MTVLLVDDNPDQLSIRTLLLEHMGFETLSGISREEALQKAAANHPQCAVVDLCLPDVETGFSTLRELRAQDAALRLIALTGYGTETWQHSAARELADEVVVKGSGVNCLIESLRKAAARIVC